MTSDQTSSRWEAPSTASFTRGKASQAGGAVAPTFVVDAHRAS
jgi:hypothetical protein